MADRVTILDAIDDSSLFGPWFKGRDHWRAWRAFLAALFGLPMSEEERAIFRQMTGRESAPTTQSREAWLVVGRRGGKSFVVALIAVYLACFRDYRAQLAPGERGVVMVIAADRRQARVVFRYVTALLRGVPMLARRIVTERADAIELSNGIDIEVHTANFRAVRGYSVVAALLDEIAFWMTDELSASPDVEIVNAIRPAMSTHPHALLIGLSSPYARRGVLWEAYRDHFGHEGDVLVWQADSRSMNPTIPQSVIDRAYANDPASAAAEYGAEFRNDVSGFLLEEWIARSVDEGVGERPALPETCYYAFADPSGGASDAFTLGIAHRQGETIVLDCLRGRMPPFEPEAAVQEFAQLLSRYGLGRVTGDRYSAEWCASAFRKHGIIYEPAGKPKSEIYLETEHLFAQGAVRLLDQRRLLNELRQLERRTGRGRDLIDHPPRGHDDFANAALGALWLTDSHQLALVNIERDSIIVTGKAAHGGQYLTHAPGSLATDWQDSDYEEDFNVLLVHNDMHL